MSRTEPADLLPQWRDVYERSLDCVHCGLCLSVCPTYRVTGRETSSPRGRIFLMRGAAEGRVPVGELLRDEAALCLGCRACETACPSGVRFGTMLERTREEVGRAGLRSDFASRLERLALRHLVPHPRRLRWLTGGLRVLQRSGLLDMLARWLPARLRDAAELLPPLPARTRPGQPPAVRGESRGRVGLLAGCVMPELFAEAHQATLRVLAAAGFETVVPAASTCCGALAAHAGDGETARALARRNLAAFADVEVVLSHSAGCGAALRDADHWLPGQGAPLAAKARDVCEWLDAEGLDAPLGRLDARVCYDDPCHLLHGQGVGEAPRRLLAAIPGLELVPHADPGACCGAAGTYNLTQPEMSAAVAERKLDALVAADPDIVATGNPGCLMQLRRGLARRRLRAEVVHPIELIDRSLRAGSV